VFGGTLSLTRSVNHIVVVVVEIAILRAVLMQIIYVVDDNCSASVSVGSCEAVWNTDVTRLYSDLIAATLNADRLRTFCRF